MHLPCCGWVDFPTEILPLIRNRYFQRLRRVTQLGLCSHVFPGATHARFEHSLGTAWLARRVVTSLRDAQPELGVTDRQVFCVTIAALIHDIGHGPLSHTFDNRVLRRIPPEHRPCGGADHEARAGPLFRTMVSDCEFDITTDEIDLILQMVSPALIGGDSWLLNIVSNSHHGLDVGKVDYVYRDAHHIGMLLPGASRGPCHLFAGVRVIGNEICFPRRAHRTVMSLYQARCRLFKDVYTHRDVCALELEAISTFDATLHYGRDWSDWTDGISRGCVGRPPHECLHDQLIPAHYRMGDVVTAALVTDALPGVALVGDMRSDAIVTVDWYTYGLVSNSHRRTQAHPLTCIAYYDDEHRGVKQRLRLEDYGVSTPSEFSYTGFRIYCADCGGNGSAAAERTADDRRTEWILIGLKVDDRKSNMYR